MVQREEEFIRLVDNFVAETKDPKILEEISEMDMESRLLGISFYDFYCLVLQDKTKHKKLVAEFNTFTSLKKVQTSLI